MILYGAFLSFPDYTAPLTFIEWKERRNVSFYAPQKTESHRGFKRRVFEFCMDTLSVFTARMQTPLSICVYVSFVNNKQSGPCCSISPAHTLTTAARQPPHLQLQPFLFLITVSLSRRGWCRRSKLKRTKEHRCYSQKYLKDARICALLVLAFVFCWQRKAVLRRIFL